VSFFNHYKTSKYFFFIVTFNFLLAVPAIYYVFFLKIFFFLFSVSETGKTLVSINPANKVILIASIIVLIDKLVKTKASYLESWGWKSNVYVFLLWIQ
jgi:hypothetical protein